MASSKKGQSATTTALEIGAGVAAAAAAAGATYWFYAADDAKKHRKSTSKWAVDMKKQVVTQAKKVQKLDQKAMGSIVDKASSMYANVKSVDASDLKAAATELKKNWKSVQAEIQNLNKKVGGVTRQAKKTGSTAKSAAKSSTKTAKRAAKTTAKKTTKAAKRG